MESKISELLEFNRILKKYNPCKPLAHKNSSLIENEHSHISPNSSKPYLKTHSIINPPQFSNLLLTDYYQLNRIKYQNYKYIKHRSTRSFFKEDLSSKNLKQHSIIPKEQKIETIYKKRKNEISSDLKYKLDKQNRILNSRYQETRNSLLPVHPQINSNRTLQVIQELKQNIQNLSVTQNHKVNVNSWVSPYIIRHENNEKMRLSSKLTNRMKNIETCVKLFQELIRLDIEKNVRLKIFSSSSQRKRTPNIENYGHIQNQAMKEDAKGWTNYGGIEDEKVSLQSFKEYYNENFNKKQWDRLFFALKINSEDSKLIFDKFLLFFQVFINKNATNEQKYEILKRAFSYPNEEIELWNYEIIENSLKTCLADKKEDFYHTKGFLETISKKVLEMILTKNTHKENIEEIIELIFLRKNL